MLIVGSGQKWDDAVKFAMSQGRVVTTGQDPSVGLGGYVQEGSHELLSRAYDLASNQNRGLFWALRKGAPGQYGVVTEYVMKHYTAPSNVVFGSLAIKSRLCTKKSHKASWNTTAAYFSHLPDLMYAQLAAAATATTGSYASNVFSGFVSQQPFNSVAVNQASWTLDITYAVVKALV